MGSSGIQAIPSAVKNVLQSGQAKTDSDSTNKTGFGSVLNQSIQSKTSQQKSTQMTKADSHPVMAKSDNKNAQVSKSSDTKSSPVTDEKEEVEKETVAIPEEILNLLGNQLMQACDDLKQMLTQQLGITDEQLDEALETLGMTMVDLFDQKNLTSFFLQVNGETDMSALLTNETMANQLQTISNQMETINPMEELHLKPEEAKAMIEQLTAIDPVDDTEPLVQTSALQKQEEDTTKSVEEQPEEVTEAPVKEIAPKVEEEMDSQTEQNTESQPKKPQTTKEVNIIVNGDMQVTTETKIQFMDQLAPTSQAKEIVEQIVKEIKVNLSTDQTSMEMVLTPETLGKVNLTVTSKNGMMTAHMVTETRTAKEAIESQIDTLKETLNQQGMKVDAVEVTVAANNFDFLNQSGMNQNSQEHPQGTRKSGGKLRMTDDSEEDYAEQEEKEKINASIGKGTQIDLTA